jgi:hypothetical protein
VCQLRILSALPTLAVSGGSSGDLERLEHSRKAGENLAELRQVLLPDLVETAKDVVKDYGVHDTRGGTFLGRDRLFVVPKRC